MNDLSSRAQPLQRNESSIKNGFIQFITALALCSGIPITASAGSELPLSQYVNPLIGTEPNPLIKEGWGWDTGNVFPGAVCPRGMLAWSPDTTHKTRIAGGYWYPDNVIEDFSLTHFSGRGVVCLMDVPFMPTLQPINGSPGANWEQFAATFSHTNESVSADYYRVTLDNGIETELTTTPRTGMARFTFPPGSPSSTGSIPESVLIRANGSISVTGNNEVTGVYHDHIGGAKDRPFTIYFIAQFDRSFERVKTWSQDALSDQSHAAGQNCGAVLTFNTARVVQVRAAISYVSLDNARANLAQENSSWDFDDVRKKADALWNTALNRIQVDGGSEGEKQTFYTALYHCFMHPNLLDDVNGEYPGMDGRTHSVEPGHHQYQNIPAWDQYRSLAPLVAILAPDDAADIAQSLVNYAQQDAAARADGGGLPRWEQVNRDSAGMVGDGDDVILADDYAFGVNQFDTRGALTAMVKGASVPGTTSDGFEVRNGLDDYLKLGYVPGKVSVTLEYCNADFALSQFADALGDHRSGVDFQNHAQNWKNLFDSSTGLLHPRNAKGSWSANFSPTNGHPGFVEGTPAQYVWMVNFNLNGLIKKMGGNKKTIARLDHFFTNVNGGVDGDTAFMGNEPCEETPWIYDFVGKPDQTQEVVRRIQAALFTSSASGIPGNDDAGALSSWYVFSALGIYPEIPGVAGFVTGSPLFSKAVIQPDGGPAIQIIGQDASLDNCYVRKLKINGRSWRSVWIPWSALSHGATLDFSLGDKPASWGKHSRPPSFDSVSH